MLVLTGEVRGWEPRRLRIRLFSATAQVVTAARRRHLELDAITDSVDRSEQLKRPAEATSVMKITVKADLPMNFIKCARSTPTSRTTD